MNTTRHLSVVEDSGSQRPHDVDWLIRHSVWGRTLGEAELDRVSAESFERQVPAGGFVARMGQPVDHWIGVIDGLLKMSVASPDGKVSTLTGINSGGWFGEGSLLKREPRRYEKRRRSSHKRKTSLNSRNEVATRQGEDRQIGPDILVDHTLGL